MATSTTGGTETDYGYDTQGALAVQTTTGSSTNYLNDPNNPTGYTKAIQVRSTINGPLIRSFVLGLNVIAQLDSNGTLYLLTDGHGSTRALVNSNSGVVQTLDYAAFGTPLDFDPNSALTTLQYGDGSYDSANGLTDNLARWTNGFWYTTSDFGPDGMGDSSDPITLHKYLYAGDDPISYRDPSGHDLSEELVTETINSVLDAIETFQGINKVRQTVSNVFDILNTAKDIALAIEGGSLMSIVSSIENQVYQNKFFKSVSPSDIFRSVANNAMQIAQVNMTNLAKAFALTKAFEGNNAAIIFQLQGFLPRKYQSGEIPTPLHVGKMPIKLRFRGGGAL